MTPKANFRPGMLPLDLSKHNLHCTGGAGSGKTRIIGVGTAKQILKRCLDALWWIDLKGDLPAMIMLRHEAERNGLPFTFFSIDPDIPSCLWNPFIDPAFLALGAAEKSDLFCEAAGIATGVDTKNNDYFSNTPRRLARALFRAFGDKIDSARSMKRILGLKSVKKVTGMTTKDIEHSSSLTTAVDSIADLWQANATPSMLSIPDSYFRYAFSVDEARTTPGLYLFHLPASLSSTRAKFFSRFLWLLAFSRAGVLGKCGVHVHGFFDEFTETMHSCWGMPLRQCRSREMSMALFHQQMADLSRVGLLDTVQGNCAVHISCSARDRDGREYWQGVGGDRVYPMLSKTTARSVSPTGLTETESTQTRWAEGPRFNSDRLNAVNANRRLALVNAAPAIGFWPFTRPVVVELMPSCAAEEFDKLENQNPTESDGVSTLRGNDIAHLFEPITTDDEADDEPPASAPVPEPTPKTPPPQPKATKKKARRQIDPEEEAKAAAVAEYLKEL